LGSSRDSAVGLSLGFPHGKTRIRAGFLHP
jgi:hypothetical protein